MNKIKVLYDVVKTMKEKETINGIINAEVIKGETNIFSFTNEFYKNNVSGDIKAKVSKEINIDGKKIKSETDAEFNMKDCPYHKFPHDMHMHSHNHEHLGFKSKLSKAAFMLNILNNLNAEDKDNKIVLSLDLKEVIKEGKEIRAEFQKSFSEKQADKDNGTFMNENAKGHHDHEFFKQLFCGDYKNAVLNIIVNKNNEIEKIEISANGETIINSSLSINY